MDIKAYIDRVDEISHLPREQQFVLLEQAREQVCANATLMTFSVLEFMLPLLFILLLAGGSYLVFGYSAWLLIISIILALLCSRVAVEESNCYLLRKSLKSLLQKNAC